MKSISAEFNNFIHRVGWQFILLNRVTESGQKLVPTALVFKKIDEIDRLVRFKACNETLAFITVLRVDFSERLSTVETDKVLKTQLSIYLKKQMQC